MTLDTRAVAAQSLPGEEDLRFIRNFHDVFLSIGILMFTAGLGVASAILVGPRLAEAAQAGEGGFQNALRIAAGAAGLDALVMWLMAEFFARGRRLFLPSIVILLAFALFFFVAAGAAWASVTGLERAFFERLQEASVQSAVREASEFFLVVSGATTLAIFAFYARMKLPFAMGLGALFLTGVGVAAVYYAHPGRAFELYQPLQLASGLFLFFLGVYFDARDPERRTRISDNGFWLHFFAAPLILNAALGMLIGVEGAIQHGTAAALVTLGVVFAFAFVSLLINRRALLVAGLIYALVSAGYLISKIGLSSAWTVAVTLLVLGGAMVLLGGGWHTLRRIVVAPFPKEGLIARIIPPEPSKDERRRVSE